jgi:myo-inositol-1(or 4)-monophosphatase
MNDFLQTAIEAARLSGKILIEKLSQRRTIARKQEFDFVTEVDRQSENAIIEFIRQRHPQHGFFAEESGGAGQQSDYLWIIDPLDGTKNYIHGFPMFAVSIALAHRGSLLVGVVLDPLRGELFHAERQVGAFLNGQRIQVSRNRDLSQCLIGTGFPFRAKHLTEPYFKAFISLFHNISDFRRAGAAALDLAYVACGRLDGFWEVTLNAWDIAAGALLIAEAGGKITDLWGGDSHLHGGHVAASNGLIHSAILAATGEPFKMLRKNADLQKTSD